LVNPFWAGMPDPFKDEAQVAYLKAQNIAFMPQHQYFDKYVLTKAGVAMADNHAIKAKLGFSDAQAFKQSMLDAVQRVASTRSGEDCGEGFQKGAWDTLFASIEH
ncbi:MAG TPA: hypothetical protein VH301_09565, partial [Usitatibacter sp.]|nr:hypothetical protein [Usitatibacter sp.]